MYFALLVLWRATIAVSEGEAAWNAAGSVAALTGLGLLAVALLAGMAWLNARATIYTVTDRRVVIRFGVALTMAINLPYRTIEAASFKAYADGTGDLPLSVNGAAEVGYLMLWPHARPWRFGAKLQPMLRSVPEARVVAETLGAALAASAEQAPVRLEDSAPPAVTQPSIATALS